MIRRRHLPILLLPLGLGACGGAAPRNADATQTSAANRPAAQQDTAAVGDDSVPVDPRAAWAPERTLHGDGFTLGYPGAARLQRRDPDGDERSAVEIAGLPGCTQRCYLTVRTYDNADRAGLTEWVRGLIQADSAAAGEEDERDYNDPPESVDLGGTPALRLIHDCGDCGWMEWYVARGDRVVGIELVMDDDVPHQASTQLTEKLESLLHSFRWDPSSHEEGLAPAPPAGIQT